MTAEKTPPPRLFDRALRRGRAARMAAAFAAHDVLHAYAAGLVAEKLLDVARSFPRALVWGDRGRHLEAALPAGKIAAVVHAGADEDAEVSAYTDANFDLVVSLLDLHAANDPVGALVQARAALKPDGLFLGVMFGAETLKELREVLAEAEIERGGLSPRIFPFADVRDAGGLLQRAGFALPVADADRLTIDYADPLRLLADLRGAGESNVLTARRRHFLARGTLLRALALYRERYEAAERRVPATFVFLTLTGWRPHESQPQPLKPGSATMRLEDALKARPS
jgi:SAM-dependent methyltransferase